MTKLEKLYESIIYRQKNCVHHTDNDYFSIANANVLNLAL